MYTPPASVVVVGSGVFGLGTALALARRPAFAGTTITVVDRGSGPEGHPDDPDGGVRDFPARDAASIDSSRIIRADYADRAYAQLAADALEHWRGTRKDDDGDYVGNAGRYSESGLVCIADRDEAAVASVKKTGMYYVRESLANLRDMAKTDPYLDGKLEELDGRDAIRRAMGTRSNTGDYGYINRSSGWADAAAAMAWTYARAKATGRIRFVRGEVVCFRDGGVDLRDGRALDADLTIAATGAWSESAVQPAADPARTTLKNTVAATGQVVAFLPLTPDEHQQLRSIPVTLNLSTGLFIFPPPPDTLELKVARHAYGYTSPEPGSSSTPMTHLSSPGLRIPLEGERDLRRCVNDFVAIPSLLTRPFSRTRICWYSDTPTGDFLIDYHPRVKGLFVATGCSGHGFKFLPVLGDKIVDAIMGQCPPEFRDKWAWRDAPSTPHELTTVITDDGSRGGLPGLILRHELAKSKAHI